MGQMISGSMIMSDWRVEKGSQINLYKDKW